MKPRLGKLHIITDTVLQSRYTHTELARLAIKGGADTVQFRQKSGELRDRLHQAESVLELCRSAKVIMIVNDRADIAAAIGADGLHLGQTDLPVPYARRLLGENKLIGGSATTIEQAIEMQRMGADYVGFGPIFPTGSKENADPPRGTEYLENVVSSLKIPVIAIGGITLERLPEVMSTGVHGVAVISAVCCADDPAVTVRTFIDVITSASRGK